MNKLVQNIQHILSTIIHTLVYSIRLHFLTYSHILYGLQWARWYKVTSPKELTIYQRTFISAKELCFCSKQGYIAKAFLKLNEVCIFSKAIKAMADVLIIAKWVLWICRTFTKVAFKIYTSTKTCTLTCKPTNSPVKRYFEFVQVLSGESEALVAVNIKVEPPSKSLAL